MTADNTENLQLQNVEITKDLIQLSSLNSVEEKLSV